MTDVEQRPEHGRPVGLRAASNLEADLSFIRELHRIAQKIDKDLSQSGRIADEGSGNLRIDSADEVKPSLCGPCHNSLNGMLQRRSEIEIDPFHLDFA